jgi:hypothetical protein
MDMSVHELVGFWNHQSLIVGLTEHWKWKEVLHTTTSSFLSRFHRNEKRGGKVIVIEESSTAGTWLNEFDLSGDWLGEFDPSIGKSLHGLKLLREESLFAIQSNYEEMAEAIAKIAHMSDTEIRIGHAARFHEEYEEAMTKLEKHERELRCFGDAISKASSRRASDRNQREQT